MYVRHKLCTENQFNPCTEMTPLVLSLDIQSIMEACDDDGGSLAPHNYAGGGVMSTQAHRFEMNWRKQ